MRWHGVLVLLVARCGYVDSTEKPPQFSNGEAAAQLVDEDEAWMSGDRLDSTYGLGGSSVLATWSSEGQLSLNPLQRLGSLSNYSDEWMPPVFMQNLNDLSVGVGFDGATAARAGSNRELFAGADIQMSFKDFAKQANWNVASSATSPSSHLLAELIAKITPFIEQEHPVELKPCSRNVVSEADSVTCPHKRDGATFEGKRRQGDALMVDVSIFGFDLDMLELKLLELKDVVDLFVVFEMPVTHKGTPKPLLWARNKDRPRFAKLSSKVLHIVIDDKQVLQYLRQESATKTLKIVQWDEEHTQEKEGNMKLQHLMSSMLRRPVTKNREIVINYGDTDEIASAHNLQLLKVCKPAKLPLDHGAWMVQGRLNSAWQSDFPVDKHYPFTHGNPCAQTLDQLKGRCFGSSGNFLLGGWHLTGNPYLPNVVMKMLTASEYSGLGSDDLKLLRSGNYGLEEYYSKTDKSSDADLALKVRPVDSVRAMPQYKGRPELLTEPCTIHRNPERYEAWFGTNDRRLELPARLKMTNVVEALAEVSGKTENLKDVNLERKLVRRHVE